MEITFISDTHGKHKKLNLKGGDLIIFSGDLSSVGYSHEIKDFLKWFSKTPYFYKVFISGNHDFYFDHSRTPYTQKGIDRFGKPHYSEENINQMLSDFPNITYLNDSGCDFEGIKIWGSPITPWFHDWAFNRTRGKDIKKHWDLIPEDIDILITHGPPHGILDFVDRAMEPQGCEDLWNRVLEVKPLIHCFGHIHEGYGSKEFHGINFINSSILNERNEFQNAPINIILKNNEIEFV